MTIRRTEIGARMRGAVGLQAEHALEALEARTLLTATFDLRSYLPADSRDSWSYVDTADRSRAGSTATLRDSVFSFTSGSSASTFQLRYQLDSSGGLRILSETRRENSGKFNEIDYQNSSLPDGLGLLPVVVSQGEIEHYNQTIAGVQTTPLQDSWTGIGAGEVRVGGLETISTSAGTFQALKITWTGEFTQNGSFGWSGQGTATHTLWLAKGLGIVRFTFSQNETNSLLTSRTDSFDLNLKDASLLHVVTGFKLTGGAFNGAIGFRSTVTAFTNGTDFGGAPVNTGSITRTFTIKNTTKFPLFFPGLPGNKLDIRISGDAAGEFKVIKTGSWRVSAGKTSTFTIKFTPKHAGDRIAEVTIAAPAGFTPFTFRIMGEGF